MSFADAVRASSRDPVPLPGVKAEPTTDTALADDNTQIESSEDVGSCDDVEDEGGMGNEGVAAAIQDSLGASRYPARQRKQTSVLNLQHPSSYSHTKSYDAPETPVEEGVVHCNAVG